MEREHAERRWSLGFGEGNHVCHPNPHVHCALLVSMGDQVYRQASSSIHLERI
jgi:hypothetical protein